MLFEQDVLAVYFKLCFLGSVILCHLFCFQASKRRCFHAFIQQYAIWPVLFSQSVIAPALPQDNLQLFLLLAF